MASLGCMGSGLGDSGSGRRCRGRDVEHDLDPAVAGLTDIVGGGDPQVLLTAANHDHVGGRHAQPCELVRHHCARRSDSCRL